jgi:methionyl-tRNA formyltransferase
VVAKDLAFLGADTPRSRAYAQALVAHGVAPERTLVMGGERRGGGGPAPPRRPWPAVDFVLLPDLSEPLLDTLDRGGWEFERTDAGAVNDQSVVTWLQASGARLGIYSGFGGQIVGDQVLAAGVPLLHVHSGWLPSFRGSTTLYYSLLRTGRCHASALLLTRGIDEGPIVARREYPAPPPGVEIDNLYDGAIRADLLVRTIDAWMDNGGVFESVLQARDEGETHYVIHPVLKHLAILSLGR